MGIDLEWSAYVRISSTEEIAKEITLDMKEKRFKDYSLEYSHIKRLVKWEGISHGNFTTEDIETGGKIALSSVLEFKEVKKEEVIKSFKHCW